MTVASALLTLASLLTLVCCGNSAPGGGFLSPEPEESIVNPDEISAELAETFEAVLGVGPISSFSDRVAFVENAVWQTFQALPKNKQGRIAPRAVRYLMHRYFNKVHGWTIEGLRGSITGMEGFQPEAGVLRGRVGIVADTVPALIEAALEARQGGRGLSMSEAVAFAVALERLVMDESVKILLDSFDVNGLSSRQRINSEEFQNVMITFASHFSVDGPVNVSDVKLHNNWDTHERSDPVLYENSELAKDLVMNFEFSKRDTANPFLPRQYFFDQTSDLLGVVANSWTRGMDTQCHELREIMEGLDPEGTGRVPVSLFAQQTKVSTFIFRESQQVLRNIGALDESVPGRPTVRIANYVMSPSNCGEYSGYYSVCCRDNCGDIIAHLESKVLGPNMDAEQLLYAVGNMSSIGDDLEGPISPLLGSSAASQSLRDRLFAIAKHNGGQVPLHGQMFAQWLHFAFPLDCPHPIKALPPSQQPGGSLPVGIQKVQSTPQEMVQSIAPKSWELVPQWTEEESNPFLDELPEDSPTPTPMLKQIMRFVALLSFFAVLVTTALHTFQTAATSPDAMFVKRKVDDYNVPKVF